MKKLYLYASLKLLETGVGSGVGSGSGSVSQRYGSANPDPHQNVTDPLHWLHYKEDLAVILIIAKSLPSVPGR
jgi:hypothetical protein